MLVKIKVRIGGLAHGGAFVGDVATDDADIPKKKVFIRHVAPGEVVEAFVTKEEKNLLIADLEDILEPSPSRVAPPCRWFGVCGGCDLQHLELGAQRAAKREMVERTLQFQGKLTPKSGVVLLGGDLPGYGYRRRIGLHLSTDGQIGFYRSGSGEVVNIDECLLASKSLNVALKELLPFLPMLAPHIGGVTLEENEGEVFIVLKLREAIKSPFQDFEVLRKKFAHLIVEDFSSVVFSQHAFEKQSTPAFPAGHFSQINEKGNEVLIKAVLDSITLPRVTELYAGAGNFSLPLAKRGVFVDAVEADPSLVQRGKELAKMSGVADRIAFSELTCEKYLRKHPLGESVLLDPPRSGAKTILAHFDAAKTKEIVYVSCSLPTLTRDLKELVAKGFSLERVNVVDMFAQTHHVETISVLKAV